MEVFVLAVIGLLVLIFDDVHTYSIAVRMRMRERARKRVVSLPSPRQNN